MQKYVSQARAEAALAEIARELDRGEDPRVLMARVNREIVAFQAAGLDVPPYLLRLTKALASECIAQSQGR